ncbi:MAG: hypothetical protein ACOCRX_07050 [Candidatus Woesearchaeota archaeon]
MEKFIFKFMYNKEVDKIGVIADNYDEALKKAKKWAEDRDVDIKIIEE